MHITHVLPNGKEVRLKEILFKDIRTFNFYENTSFQGRVEFLQSFILTKGLNILEQFYALIYLRLHCIGDDIIMTSDKGDVGVSLEFIKKNIGGIPDITTIVNIDGAEYTLDFPFHFNTGNGDFILSLIKTIRIGTESLHISELTKKEQEEVIGRLPEQLYKIIDQYLIDCEEFFNLTLLENREGLDIQPIKFSILQTSFAQFIVSMFKCVTTEGYRELLFTVSKRINDISFLINSTYLEVYDYFEMYTREIEERKSQQGVPSDPG